MRQLLGRAAWKNRSKKSLVLRCRRNKLLTRGTIRSSSLVLVVRFWWFLLQNGAKKLAEIVTSSRTETLAHNSRKVEFQTFLVKLVTKLNRQFPIRICHWKFSTTSMSRDGLPQRSLYHIVQCETTDATAQSLALSNNAQPLTKTLVTSISSPKFKIFGIIHRVHLPSGHTVGWLRRGLLFFSNKLHLKIWIKSGSFSLFCMLFQYGGVMCVPISCLGSDVT